MSAEIISGKELSLKIRGELKEKISALKEKGKNISLAVVLVGNDPASQVYVRNKIKACEEVGIESCSYTLPEDTPQEKLEELVEALSEDENINGILVQLPLPKHIDAEKVLKLIPREKDVDGFSLENMGAIVKGEDALISCTAFRHHEDV